MPRFTISHINGDVDFDVFTPPPGKKQNLQPKLPCPTGRSRVCWIPLTEVHLCQKEYLYESITSGIQTGMKRDYAEIREDFKEEKQED